MLIQLGVKECIMQGDDKRADHELTKLRTLVERCGVIVTERKSSELSHALSASWIELKCVADFIPRSVEQDLNRLLDERYQGNTLRKS
jgi:DNA mismatch repair protein MSH2